MEWNSKSTTEWEWENTAICSGGPIDIDQVLVENESTYLSADLGIGSLSKAYEKKDLDEIGNGFPNKTGEFQFADCSSTGLKLGGGSSNFEEMCGDKKVSLSVIPASSSSSGKRARASYQSVQMPRCQVEGCNLDLTSAKDYHRRHRICESHSKCPKVIVAGLERRFCQQCSRFHDLAEFDEKKRSCRRRLSDHNARRRRQQPEAFHFGSTRLSSLYDQRLPQMNFLLNGVPIRISNQIWERGSGYGGGGGDSSLLVGHLNDQEYDGSRLIYPNNLMIPNYIPPPPRLSHRGGETSLGIISTSSSNNANYNNGEGAPKEVHHHHHNRVLSLLSTDSPPPPLNNNSFQQFNNFPIHHQQEQQFTPQYISHPLMNLVDPPHPNILSSPDLLQHNINVVVSSNSTQLFYPNHPRD